MVKVVVTGISIISCLGDTKATWQGVINGISGIKFRQPFDYLSCLPLGLIKSHPSFIGDVTFTLIKDLINHSNLELPLKDTGIVIGSSRGCQSQWEIFLSSPKPSFSPLWLNTLPYQPSIITANYIQTNASVLSPTNACATGLSSIAQGYELIKQKRCKSVIVGAVETPITPLTIAGFSQMKALSNKGCDPFGKERSGFVLGEGGAMLMLETEESARNRQAKIYGEILGWGMSCDAQTMTAPEKEAYTAIKTIKLCLERSQIQPEEIDYINAHGTGTILNDRREAKIINHLFPQNPKVSSTKGVTGHTLGASGAIATALSFLSLEKQILLPNTNLSCPEFDLNFCTQGEKYSLQKMLCFSFGFGGQNAVLAIRK
ncbi:beta-ketoacyl-ACP synthase [Geminocystis sp. NIES-3709]|uniref:beta-ketoacyl-ACP synthase n=1 Tax=Geminocystis sp. NIES-3709 TaxID=1617448 RepID=UPI0005FCDBC6|nr:beta-ketoacyl-ACP synthase [Geminocystis sp. NIES-3709]BAQ63593.1 3-oxoacyl-[acyl-carrier-protein] synthase [Geminocystis sp. NIES-3709]